MEGERARDRKRKRCHNTRWLAGALLTPPGDNSTTSKSFCDVTCPQSSIPILWPCFFLLASDDSHAYQGMMEEYPVSRLWVVRLLSYRVRSGINPGTCQERLSYAPSKTKSEISVCNINPATGITDARFSKHRLYCALDLDRHAATWHISSAGMLHH